jgi:hypothetical protein
VSERERESEIERECVCVRVRRVLLVETLKKSASVTFYSNTIVILGITNTLFKALTFENF